MDEKANDSDHEVYRWAIGKVGEKRWLQGEDRDRSRGWVDVDRASTYRSNS
jgi:hypothetical protein